MSEVILESVSQANGLKPEVLHTPHKHSTTGRHWSLDFFISDPLLGLSKDVGSE